MVNNYGNNAAVKVTTNVFRPDCVRGNVETKSASKTFKVVYDKSMVDSRLDCYPFGYTANSPFNHIPPQFNCTRRIAT